MYSLCPVLLQISLSIPLFSDPVAKLWDSRWLMAVT
jgi:hypothetical protein